MATLKVEYHASGYEWYTDVTRVRAALSWRVPNKPEDLANPYASCPGHGDFALAPEQDMDLIRYGADVAYPSVVHSGLLHEADAEGGDGVDVIMLVVYQRGTPDPFGVIVPHRWAWLMNEAGDTIDRF